MLEKNSNHLNIDLYKPSHVTMTKHLGSKGFYGLYAFRCRIGLKLFLRLACAMGKGTTKFGIFLRWFGTFSYLIEFLEVELSLPQNDL